MIINTGQRTDIPAFYSRWFTNRLKEGLVASRSPYDAKTVYLYKLEPSTVDVITFTTKNPYPMLNHLDSLSAYKTLWHVTITPYGRDVELNVPDKEEVIASFAELSKVVGRDCMVWRYDPILLWGKYSLEYHKLAFEEMLERLAPYTSSCVFSFVKLYEKVKRNFPSVQEASVEERIEFASFAVEKAKRLGVRMRECGSTYDLSFLGVEESGCMVKADLEKACGCELNLPRLSKTRNMCSCYLSHDIGAYNSCLHYCKYCYANSSIKAVEETVRAHNDSSPLLIGEIGEDDVVRKVEMESWKSNQLQLF